MQKMKKESGITMTVLVITIIVLGIIGAVLISYSVVGTKETKNKKISCQFTSGSACII